jgi:isocitrate/isopropylmalate dehydrogenase
MSRRPTTTSGPARYNRTGEVLPDSVLGELRGHDAVLLGAVGDPSVPPGVLERGLLLKLRFDFDQYVNLRPSRLWPGTTSPLAGVKPGEIDLVVVREGTEGLYVGAGGNLHRAPRPRSPPRRASTPATASSGSSATPSPAPRSASGAR